LIGIFSSFVIYYSIGFDSQNLKNNLQLLYIIENPKSNNSTHFVSSVNVYDDSIIVGSVSVDPLDATGAVIHIFNLDDGTLTLEISNPTNNPQFGTSVVADSDIIAVGSPVGKVSHVSNTDYVYSGISGGLTATVSIFDKTSGQLLFTLTNPNSDISEPYFGSVITISDDNIIVGSPYTTKNFVDRSISVFDKSSGNLLYQIFDPGYRIDGSLFANKIVSNDKKILTPDFRSLRGYGAVHVYDVHDGKLLFQLMHPIDERTPDYLVNQTEIDKYVSSHPAGRFGYSAYLLDNDVLVGSPYTVTETSLGAAYLFNGTTGELIFEIENPTKIPLGQTIGGKFGSFVYAYNDNILVGNYDDGYVSMFDRKTGEFMHQTFYVDDTFRYFSIVNHSLIILTSDQYDDNQIKVYNIAR